MTANLKHALMSIILSSSAAGFPPHWLVLLETHAGRITVAPRVVSDAREYGPMWASILRIIVGH